MTSLFPRSQDGEDDGSLDDFIASEDDVEDLDDDMEGDDSFSDGDF